MAITQVTYTGDGATTLYSFSFPYLENADVKVEVNEVLQTITTEYTFANATTIQFVAAPANGAAIRIYRDTDIEDTKAEFYPGSSIRAQNLNDNFDQTIYAVQEIKTQYQTLYEPVFPDDLDMDGNQINNLADPTSPQDAVTKSYADTTFVDAAGDTMSGVLNMGTNKITNLDTPSSAADAATKNYVDSTTWNVTDETIQTSEAWVGSNAYIATTGSIDNRIDSKIDAAITGDIASDGTGITVTDDGDGTITLGLAANSIDFDRIKDVDIITQAEQNAGSPAAADTNLFTALASAKRFDTLVQLSTPSGSDWEVGKTWLQNDANLTLSIWNGSSWIGVASGGTFTNLPKVVYVDAVNGNDSNDGHRISSPKKTIKASIDQINADATYGDGSVVIVAPGVYQEEAPISITRKDVSIIGQALRSCIVHPTTGTEENTLFRVNSGSYIANLTLTGVKASGTRGLSTIDGDATYGLPENQGWNFAFYPGAMIYKSPYIQNCTNFSDSEINNASLDPHTPAGGAGGDTDSAMTGGGLLIDGSVVDASSPLRSMVCDSYTHVGLDGPGILVTNNGYCQATSSYSFFTHYHIKCRDGGQANLAASTTDFGRYSLVADGKSQNAIFTALTTALADDGDITFTIDEPTPGSPWHGTATRPQSNMLVDIGGNTYPILSATANGLGWDVTISRPNPANKSENLGLDGSVASGSTASFYLRSMIASSGHTMEYVGSGTNYTALPENGGVPIEANQVIELNDGKIWAAITDHNGKFKLGDTLTVDQQIGFVTIPSGSIAFDLASDLSPQLGGNLDVLNRSIASSTGNVVIDDTVDLNSHPLINVTDPTSAQDAATKKYVDDADATKLSLSGGTMTGDITFNGTQSFPGVLPLSGGTMTGNITFNAGQTFPDVLPLTGGTLTGDITLDNQSDLRFGEATGHGGNWVAFQAPSTIAANVTWTLPDADATVSGHALKSDGAGNLSWGTAGGAAGGGTDDIFYENSQTVTTNYTITTNKNAMTAGPVAIDSGVTVTVPSGSSWVIV